MDKHFPRTRKLSKIINKNTVKVSYTCMPNFKQAIINHNRRLLQDRIKTNPQAKKFATAEIEKNAL